MKVYKPNDEGWLCGYWNGSPIQIKYSDDRPLKDEGLHIHNSREYYLMVEGKLTLKVDGKEQTISELELIMIEPGEPHKIIKKSKKCKYVIVKEKSEKYNKKMV